MWWNLKKAFELYLCIKVNFIAANYHKEYLECNYYYVLHPNLDINRAT